MNSIKENITFTKISVLWADLMILAVPIVSIIMKEYPPDYVVYVWVGWWMLRIILTAVLHVKKKGRKQKYTFFEGVAPYINEKNVSALLSHYVGIEPVYQDGSQKKRKGRSK